METHERNAAGLFNALAVIQSSCLCAKPVHSNRSIQEFEALFVFRREDTRERPGREAGHEILLRVLSLFSICTPVSVVSTS